MRKLRLRVTEAPMQGHTMELGVNSRVSDSTF